MAHVVASISAHGFGHMAITAPVLEKLYAVAPDWTITVSSGIPEATLRTRIRCPFRAVSDETDFGLRMRRDLSVDVNQTLTDYAELYRRWDEIVDQRARWLSGIHCDLLLSNVSFFNIAGAARAGIPTMALSPLNWADLYRHFAPATSECARVFARMVDAYNQAEVFLAPEPCMPMPHFGNLEVIPPVAQTGTSQRALVQETFDLDERTRLVLLALGGLETVLDGESLPVIEGVKWLVEGKRGYRRDDALNLERTGLAFPDLLASSDLLMAKPGYGAFAEAACLGKPVAYVRRSGWPEEVFLIDWLTQLVPCREASLRDLGVIERTIAALLQAPQRPGCPADGVGVCVERILGCLR